MFMEINEGLRLSQIRWGKAVCVGLVVDVVDFHVVVNLIIVFQFPPFPIANAILHSTVK